MPKTLPRGILTHLTSIDEFVRLTLQGSLSSREYINIAPLPSFLEKSLGLLQFSKENLRLSAETVYQHHQKHKEATPIIYNHICPLILEKGIWLRIPQLRNGIIEMRVCAYIEYEEKIWKMGIKVTSFAEIYISTLFRSNTNQFKREMRNGGIIK